MNNLKVGNVVIAKYGDGLGVIEEVPFNEWPYYKVRINKGHFAGCVRYYLPDSIEKPRFSLRFIFAVYRRYNIQSKEWVITDKQHVIFTDIDEALKNGIPIQS